MLNDKWIEDLDSGNQELCKLEIAYLQAELARVDVLVRRELLRWALAEQNASDDYRGLYITQAEVEAMLANGPGLNWGDTVELPAEEETALRRIASQATLQAQEILHRMAEIERIPRLKQLVDAFALDLFDCDILLLCLAPALDTRYERFYGFLQDNVTLRRPTVRLVLQMLGGHGLGRLLHSPRFSQHSSPLFRYELIERVVEQNSTAPHLINQTLHVHESVVAWLLGDYQPHPMLKGNATLLSPHSSATDAVLTEDIWPRIEGLLPERGSSTSSNSTPVLALSGIDVGRNAAVARRIASQIGTELLSVDLGRIVGEDCTPQRAVRLALRDARMTNAQLYLCGWDACIDSDDVVVQGVLAEVCEFPGMVVLSGQKGWHANDLTLSRRIYPLKVPVPGYQERTSLWIHLLTHNADKTPEMSHEAKFDIAGLAGQFALSSEQIEHAVAGARDLAGCEGRTIRNEDLFSMARAVSNPQLGHLARKITPRYSWEDLVLPADQIAILGEMVATVRGRSTVLIAWGVGKKLASSAGVTALFAGPPGTGKTMAAEVIAHVLGLDLYKIELSSIVSKYIGETEKNLERIFHEAATSNSILFFDEADAIFGKRSEVRDAHDRYANIEVSYLLQRMEAYDGVTILATNLRANLDDAFARRLQFAVDFPFPGRVERLHIWQTLFPPDVPRDASLDFELLARRFELAGGNIRNIIVSAAYLAAADGGRVTMSHLMHSTRREFQKMGRLVDIEDFTASLHM